MNSLLAWMGRSLIANGVTTHRNPLTSGIHSSSGLFNLWLHMYRLWFLYWGSCKWLNTCISKDNMAMIIPPCVWANKTGKHCVYWHLSIQCVRLLLLIAYSNKRIQKVSGKGEYGWMWMLNRTSTWTRTWSQTRFQTWKGIDSEMHTPLESPISSYIQKVLNAKEWRISGLIHTYILGYMRHYDTVDTTHCCKQVIG